MKRRFFAPEIIQASWLDCGPAALKCLLEGFGIPVRYDRLREACQTQIDGTSIDALEDVGTRLGLAMQQQMLPRDNFSLARTCPLPAIVVVNRPDGGTHFVVLWRRIGPWVQVMDPATGRRWRKCAHFVQDLYVHETAIPAHAWERWARSAAFFLPLKARLVALCGTGSAPDALMARAFASDGWVAPAILDAAVRFTTALHRAGGVRRGSEALGLLQRLTEQPESELFSLIPPPYWPARPAPEHPAQPEAPPHASCTAFVRLRGAVFVGVDPNAPTPADAAANTAFCDNLTASLGETPRHPLQEMWSMVRADNRSLPFVLLGAMLLAACAVLVEAVLLRSLLDLTVDLTLARQRSAGALALATFLAAMLCLELPTETLLWRTGRHLDMRLRLRFAQTLPHLPERYFSSRLSSDMAERVHSAHRLRQLPALVGSGVRLLFELVFTTAGIIWLSPQNALIALGLATLVLAIPLLAQPPLNARDLRVRTHLGTLAGSALDTLFGATTVRAHDAQTAVRREHDALVAKWQHAATRALRGLVATEGAQLIAGFGMATWLLLRHIHDHGSTGTLLLVYWVLRLPMIGQDLTQLLLRLPTFRSLLLRLLEPLHAQGNTPPSQATVVADARSERAITVEIADAMVVAGGRTILEGIDLHLQPGAHVAVVGASGSGKSTLAALLLGLHPPTAGHAHLDGAAATPERETLKSRIAWVDPAAQLWNQSLLANLMYGVAQPDAGTLGDILHATALHEVLQRLPQGLQHILGEGGRLVSGGEGQRIRLARALLRPNVGLAVLDEPFRGLDEASRAQLLQKTRLLWRRATLIYITHDVAHTTAFDDVVVMQAGRVIERGNPMDLQTRPDSHYGAMLRDAAAMRSCVRADPRWAWWRLDHGHLTQDRKAAQ